MILQAAHLFEEPTEAHTEPSIANEWSQEEMEYECPSCGYEWTCNAAIQSKNGCCPNCGECNS